jgi:hypothetical protein
VEQRRKGMETSQGWTLTRLVLLVVVVALVAAACGNRGTVDTPEPEATDTPMGAAGAPSPTPTSDAAEATLAISPSSGPPGTEVEVAAAGFPAEAEIELRIGQAGTEYVMAASERADAEGVLTTSLIIPTSAEPGEEWVVAATTTDEEVEAVSNVFQVTEPEYDPAVRIAPTSGPPGTTVEMVGEDFPPGATVEIGVGREDSEYDVVKSTEVQTNGSFVTMVTIPGFAEAEERWVVVGTTDDPGSKAVSNVFEVTQEEYQGSVAISPTSGPAGTTVDVVARGFPPNTAVEIGIGRVDSEYDVVAQARTGSGGRVSTQIVLPDFVEPEDDWVIVVAAEDPPVKAVSDVFDVTGAAGPAETPTPGGALFTRVDIFLIALGDDGQRGPEVGCDDSVVPVEVEIEPTIAPLTAALDRLLAIETEEHEESGLYNALYRSELTLDEVAIQDREAVIRLSGTLDLGGVCDGPRIRAQLRQTALQFATVSQVSIFINGTPLDELIRGAGATPTPTGDLFTQTEIYLIAVGDGGQSGMEIGCGDSVVPVEVEIEPTIAPLTAALEELLAIGTREYGLSGLYNALYRSDLALEDVVIEDGEAVIRLSGTLVLGGACDEPRVRAQLRQTALQYETVDRVSIFIDGTPLEDLLGEG